MRGQNTGRALEFECVAFRVGDVNRGAVAFRAVTVLRFAGRDASGAQVQANRVFIPRLDAQAEVINVPAFQSGCRAAGAAERSVDVDQVDQRMPRAQLDQPELVLARSTSQPSTSR